MKKLFAWTIIALFLLPLVFAGVSNPLPSNIEIQKGESARFKFQIQAVNSDSDLLCKYSFKDKLPFTVKFDAEEALIPAGTRDNVYGTVIMPDDATPGVHSADFCVSCRPKDAPAGASVNIDTCGLTLKTTVVEERTRDNLFVPEKENPMKNLKNVLVIAGLVLIAIIAFLLWYVGRKRRQPQPHMLIPVRSEPVKKKPVKVSKKKTSPAKKKIPKRK